MGASQAKSSQLLYRARKYAFELINKLINIFEYSSWNIYHDFLAFLLKQIIILTLEIFKTKLQAYYLAKVSTFLVVQHPTEGRELHLCG